MSYNSHEYGHSQSASYHHHQEEGLPPPPMPGMSRQSFQGPTDEYLAAGYVEQWRRSKMQRIWKPVRIVLSKTDMVLWVQRENAHYGQGGMETLQRIPLSEVRSVGLVDEYMGERRFTLFVPDQVDDSQVMFRCDEPASANKWITTLKMVKERRSQPRAAVAPPPQTAPPPRTKLQATPPPPPKPVDLLSFHVVTPTPMQQQTPPPPPPRPLEAADFDPFNARRNIPAPPSSAPAALRGGQVTPPQQHYRPPPPAPHNGGASPSAWQHQQQQQHPDMMMNQQAALRQAVLNQWALAPPHRQHLRSLDQLVTTVQTTFGILPPQSQHAYFRQWAPVPYNDLCTHHILDFEKIDKAVRKLKAFLHPDKWPTTGFNDEAQSLCRLLWDILQNVQEQQAK